MIVTAALLALAVPAGAHEPVYDECPAWSEVVAVPPAPARHALYVVYDEFTPFDHDMVPFSVWIYAESNGVEGLQRHDGYCATPGYGHAGEPDADTIIF